MSVVTLNITRTKKDDEIWEYFWITPDNYLCYDDKREVYYKIWKQRNKMAIHNNGYKLINIVRLEKKIIYIYEYDNNLEIPSHYETCEIKYNPVLGKKTCLKCKHERQMICSLRGKKLTKYSYYKCTYWMERERGDRHIFTRKQTNRNDKTYAIIPRKK